ncbi:MAG: N(4)-(beta-N-acetylglucosaminyl)-L-asparaginase [Phycisphaerae bacterium]|nr:N(4)-(beta-N-acetylglucosaminyl)-L-asparaginase [Phycisphaerae bacterium]
METLHRRRFLAAAGLAVAGVPALARQPEGEPAAAHEGDDHRGACAVASSNGQRAAARAMELIAQGYDPADAVVQGVRLIEDDPSDHSVGLGGLPNEEGVVELDASVMHGPTHKSGAVAGLRGIRNPALVALQVLRRTDHCLLVGEGALRFARQMGFAEENLLTEEARRIWLRWKANASKDDDWLNDDERDPPAGKEWGEGDKPRSAIDPAITSTTGTVHCSAVTPAGDLAGCTSTSGLSWKIPGRVGDSPIIGAGNYCDNAIGSAGSTGRGESAIVNLCAFRIVDAMGRGLSPTRACLEAARAVAQRTLEKRLLRAPGRPNFNILFYALRKDGAFGGASLMPGGRFAVDTGTGPRLVQCPSHFEAQR